MSDPWVEATQNWLNTTYKDVPGWNPVAVTKQTGWPTMYALIRALQHELGITALSDNFGDGTMTALTKYGNISPATTNSNIINILVGGMYCKGYDGGGGKLDGTWRNITTSEINRLQTNIGLTQTGFVAPKLFKAILNMDAYIVIGSGQKYIREVQQWMNGRYLDRSWFSIIPADGSYSRDVQKALVYAIQEELNVAGANGNYGPGTRAAINSRSAITVGDTDQASKCWVRLFQAALRFNNIESGFNGSFSSADSDLTADFQRFACLPVTGKGDYQTFSSLLVSSGDPERVGKAADCVTQITPERATTLVANGRTLVGRYLTGTSGSTTSKKIQPGELDIIFSHGLRVFPIYQTSASTADYFSSDQGHIDAVAAVRSASDFNFKPGTIIYFAVDFDATGDQITARIIPYFNGINQTMTLLGNKYLIGVYGTRNVCSQIATKALAKYSFVAGMSTGYSGNLGFSLPPNWAFDQISTVTIGSATGAIEIDNDIASGRDFGQSTVDRPSSGEKLDIEFNMSKKAALSDDIAKYCQTVKSNTAHLSHGTPENCVSALLQHDSLVTNLACSWGIRKALIQVVAFWEYWKTTAEDAAADTAVEATYYYMISFETWQQTISFGPPPTPPPIIKEDSSTGFAQIFASTAIWGHNWAISHGLSNDSLWDDSDWHQKWDIWQKLNEDDEFNLAAIPSVLLAGTDDVGISGLPRLSFNSDEIIKIIARYNGKGDDAQRYGNEVKGLYDIFEKYNATIRE